MPAKAKPSILQPCETCGHPRLTHDRRGCHAPWCGPDRAEVRCRRFVSLETSRKEALAEARKAARKDQGTLW